MRIALTVTLVGGVVMLVVAAVAHDSASIPIAGIGGAWFLAGVAGLRKRRSLVREVQLDGDRVTFARLNGEVTVPAVEIVEVRRPRYDPGNVAPLEMRTRSNGSIRVPAPLEGLLDLLVELRLQNPSLDTTRV